MEITIKMDDLGGKPHYVRKHPHCLCNDLVHHPIETTLGWKWSSRKLSRDHHGPVSISSLFICFMANFWKSSFTHFFIGWFTSCSSFDSKGLSSSKRSFTISWKKLARTFRGNIMTQPGTPNIHLQMVGTQRDDEPNHYHGKNGFSSHHHFPPSISIQLVDCRVPPLGGSSQDL